MTTPWTSPTSYVNGIVIGASDMNTYVRDNMVHLKDPPYSGIVTAYGAAPSATASTAIPITAGLSAVLTTYGGAVQVYFNAYQTGAQADYNLYVDGTAYTNAGGGLAVDNVMPHYNVWVTGLASGSHVFVPTWLADNPNEPISINNNYPVVFWVREG